MGLGKGGTGRGEMAMREGRKQGNRNGSDGADGSGGRGGCKFNTVELLQ